MNDAMSLKFVKNPTDKLQTLAVKLIPAAIKHITNPSTSIMRLAISMDCYSIGFMNDPPEFIQEEAIAICGYAIDSVYRPTVKMFKLASLTLSDDTEFINEWRFLHYHPRVEFKTSITDGYRTTILPPVIFDNYKINAILDKCFQDG